MATLRDLFNEKRKTHDRRLRAAFSRDEWAKEWNSLPTAIDNLLSEIFAECENTLAKTYVRGRRDMAIELRNSIMALERREGGDGPYVISSDLAQVMFRTATPGFDSASTDEDATVKRGPSPDVGKPMATDRFNTEGSL